MLEDILRLNALAAADGNYETAYHLLMAALHWVDKSGGNLEEVDRIAGVAREQGTAVEAAQPPHLLSRQNAQARGQTSLFDSFQAHVDAVRARMESVRLTAKRAAI